MEKCLCKILEGQRKRFMVFLKVAYSNQRIESRFSSSFFFPFSPYSSALRAKVDSKE